MDRRVQAEAILKRRSPALIAFFEWQFRRQLCRNFAAVRLSRAGLPPLSAELPIVVYSNHPSWWDAVIYFHLGRTLFRDRVGYGPIDSTQLSRYPLLDRLGLFGIDPDSFAGAARFLSIAKALLSKPRAMLWVAAEGHFTDPRQRPIGLRHGLSHLAGAVPGVLFVPLAIEYTFWNQKKPEVLLRFGRPLVAATEARSAQIELEAALAEAMDALAEDSAARDETRFHTLLRGRAGISASYDLLRRAHAFLHGEPYHAAHRA